MVTYKFKHQFMDAIFSSIVRNHLLYHFFNCANISMFMYGGCTSSHVLQNYLDPELNFLKSVCVCKKLLILSALLFGFVFLFGRKNLTNDCGQYLQMWHLKIELLDFRSIVAQIVRNTYHFYIQIQIESLVAAYLDNLCYFRLTNSLSSLIALHHTFSTIFWIRNFIKKINFDPKLNYHWEFVFIFTLRNHQMVYSKKNYLYLRT